MINEDSGSSRWDGLIPGYQSLEGQYNRKRMLVVAGRGRTEALWVLDRLERIPASDFPALVQTGAVDYRTELFALAWKLLAMALQANWKRAKAFRHT